MRRGAGSKDQENITTVVNSRALMRQLRGMQPSVSRKGATTGLNGSPHEYGGIALAVDLTAQHAFATEAVLTGAVSATSC